MPLPSRAEESSTESEGLLSTSAVAELLQAVPTFTIVDKKGVPFMVVGEDAKVLDAMVREDPEQAYELSFYEKLTGRGHMSLSNNDNQAE